MYCEMCGDATVKKYCDTCMDEIEKSSHYNQGRYEVIEVIEDWEMNFNLGNVLKYIARCNHKGNKKKDLEKAIYYIRREIENGP